MKYKIGQLVLNKKLGLGKVLEISGDEVMTYFKDAETNPRTINVGVVPMEIPSDQTDPFFDGIDSHDLAKLKKPSKMRSTVKSRAAKAAKTAAAAAAAAGAAAAAV